MNTPQHPIPSIFDTYNAKWLSPSEVAESFVPPPQFAQIVKRTNSLIVGPRGCGKTTLLKMLTEPAGDAWHGEAAARYKSRIDYTGVFVATDVTWNSQVSALGDERLSPDSRRLLQVSALTTHTHKALIEAMEWRARRLSRKAGLANRDHESRLVMELMAMWKLPSRVPSFHSVKTALRLRMQSIHETADIVAGLAYTDQGRYLNGVDYIRTPLLVSCRNAVEQFNDTFDDREQFWGFLFDELELMPAAIRQELFWCLRTLPDRVLFKLALSPFDDDVTGIGEDAPAQPGHDFDFVPLWFALKRRATKFCTALWNGMVRGTRLDGKSPQEVLGRSILDTESEDWAPKGSAYVHGSKHEEYVTTLSEQDATFRSYLAAHGISASRIEAVRGTRRAATLRKVFPLVVARVEYAKTVGGANTGNDQSQLRSRKLSMIYTGAMSLFDVSEGNPRVFKGLISRLLDRLPEGQAIIDPQVQADEITQAIGRFRALLRTIVVPETKRERFPRGLLSLLDPIARRMQSEALVDRFAAEPAASFVVDSTISEDEVRMIGYAMNSGAIIYVPNREGEVELLSMSRVRERRFRLSYLFAAQYAIVPRLGRRVSLRELMGHNSSPGLFGEEART